MPRPSFLVLVLLSFFTPVDSIQYIQNAVGFTKPVFNRDPRFGAEPCEFVPFTVTRVLIESAEAFQDEGC